MKYLKVVFLSFIVLIVSGCSIEANLIIKDDRYRIEVNGYAIKNDEYDMNYYESLIKDDYLAINENSELKYFKYSNINEVTRIGRNYYYDFNRENLRTSNPLTMCFNSVGIASGVELTYISLRGFSCMGYNDVLVRDVTISITIDKMVNEHNANKVENNKYTWVPNDNGEMPNIEFSFYDVTESETKRIEDNTKNIVKILSYVIIGCVVVLATANIFIKKNENLKKK